jgi:hypothetical protein
MLATNPRMESLKMSNKMAEAAPGAVKNFQMVVPVINATMVRIPAIQPKIINSGSIPCCLQTTRHIYRGQYHLQQEAGNISPYWKDVSL